MPMIRKIDLVLYEPEMSAEEFVQEMKQGFLPDYITIFHAYFGQEAIEFQTNKTLEALKEQIKVSTSALQKYNPELCMRLSRACDEPTTFYGEMGVCGRLLAEEFCKPHQKQKNTPDLMNQIIGLPNTAPWIKSHLHNLRVLGNMSVHLNDNKSYEPKLPSDKELLLLLLSIQAILSHYEDIDT